MKVRLSVGQKPYSGYVNVDPCPVIEQGQELNTVQSDIRNLDGIVENSQATEILAVDVLDYVSANELITVLQNWVIKLRHDGKIVVGGTDPYETAKSYVAGRIDTVEFNYTVFGNSKQDYSQKSGCITLTELWQILQNMGLRITKKSMIENKMFVEAYRK